MTREGGASPYHFTPGDLGAPREPVISIVDLVGVPPLKAPDLSVWAPYFECVFHGTNLFPGPAAICGRGVVPPFSAFDVTTMNPFDPEDVLLGSDSPNKLSNDGFVPSHEVFNPGAPKRFSFARVGPGDGGHFGMFLRSPPKVVPTY